MSAADAFFDTSVLLYLLSPEADKADRVEELLAERATISVQVLNEFAAVATRKLRMTMPEVRKVLDTLRAVCDVEPVTVETHDRALAIAERYGYSLYDSLLIAAALIAGSGKLYSEDLQHGQLIDRRLRVRQSLQRTLTSRSCSADAGDRRSSRPQLEIRLDHLERHGIWPCSVFSISPTSISAATSSCTRFTSRSSERASPRRLEGPRDCNRFQELPTLGTQHPEQGCGRLEREYMCGRLAGFPRRSEPLTHVGQGRVSVAPNTKHRLGHRSRSSIPRRCRWSPLPRSLS